MPKGKKADDLKLLRAIESKQNMNFLQSDIDSIVLEKKNGMELNPCKCYHMKLTRKNQTLYRCTQFQESP